MEQPMRDPRSCAFIMMFSRLGGCFPRSSNISVTPPVKSSMASEVLPPFSDSYDPFSLKTAIMMMRSLRLRYYIYTPREVLHGPKKKTEKVKKKIEKNILYGL